MTPQLVSVVLWMEAVCAILAIRGLHVRLYARMVSGVGIVHRNANVTIVALAIHFPDNVIVRLVTMERPVILNVCRTYTGAEIV